MSRVLMAAVAAFIAMAAPALASALYPSHAPSLQNSEPPGGKHKGGIFAGDGSIVPGSGFSVSHNDTGE